MKQLWDAQELADKWSLSFKDLELLSSKPHRNPLRFCSQLKYYQITGKFPDRSKDIPDTTLHYLNDQLKTSLADLDYYDWFGRSGRRHRLEILSYLQVRKVTKADKEKAVIWLVSEILPHCGEKENLHARTHNWFHVHRIICPASKEVNRIVARAYVRYGGRAVMIYWHVEKKSTCIYCQLKRCSSSEVASMIEGVLRHCTSMEIDHQYVDSHGQSEVAFAFCHLLGFDLLPRLKAIGSQKLYQPRDENPGQYPNLAPILTRPINWKLIQQQYDQIIKYTTALKLGTADPESIFKRFTQNNIQHPTYRALMELGKAIKTIFLCRYIREESLRREINEGLNVVENWNSANSFIFYGKGGEVATNRSEDQELSVLSLHLLQICLVYVNTLLIQDALREPVWLSRMTQEDYRALSPLLYGHINPYGIFDLDMESRLILRLAA